MPDAKLKRLKDREANAWRNYQEARRKMHERRSASRTAAVVDLGAKWSYHNDALHGYLSSLGYDKRAELWPIYA